VTTTAFGQTLAIVGASLAGAKAAESAREAGHDGPIILVGDEDAAPYERPPLSKAVLRGEAEPASARVHPEGFYAEHGIDLITDRVCSVDLATRTLQLDGGDVIPFDTAILATGAEPRRLDMRGADLAGVHYLRNVGDAIRLRDAIRRASRVAVIGAGWIGSEVTASARQMGADVLLVEPAHVPLHRVLGDEVGEVFRRLHADNGVELRLGVGVTELRGTKTVEGVVLNDGRVEPADVVVVGIGVVPRVELAGAAGLTVENGIVVDEHLQASVGGIYAAGDVANAWHPHYGRRIRVEHWANAANQGATAGRNATGDAEPYVRLPYFFSDQFDVGIEYVGYGQLGDSVAIRGDVERREFIAFWHRGGRVTAAMSVNVWDVIEDLKTIVAAKTPADLARLANPHVPLGELVR
jgi:3-phenylpropionate/trans-cinnamate dioxygenase ferredoxin reductase subunit